MGWIYLIIQAVGLGIIAWSFKVEDKNGYAITFEIGGFLSLFVAMATAPIPLMLLTGCLMVLFRSKINLALADRQTAIVSSFRKSLQTLTKLGSNGFAPVVRRMLEPLTLFMTQYSLCWRQEQQRADVQYPNKSIIDVEAIDVSR